MTSGFYSDITLEWTGSDAHGACQGDEAQGDDVDQLHENNGITLMTNNAPQNSCVYRTAVA